MPRWRYKVISVNVTDKWSSKRQAEEFAKLQERLDALGEDGWEMISYESVPLLGRFSKDLHGYAYLCFFKKQV